MDKLPEYSKFFGEIWENNQHNYDIRVLDGILFQTKPNSLFLAAPMPLSDCCLGFMDWLEENPSEMFRISENFCFEGMESCKNRK